MQGTFDGRFIEFDLGSFGALCKISNFTIFKTLVLPNFHPMSSKLYTSYHKHGAKQDITFLVDLPKIPNIMAL